MTLRSSERLSSKPASKSKLLAPRGPRLTALALIILLSVFVSGSLRANEELDQEFQKLKESEAHASVNKYMSPRARASSQNSHKGKNPASGKNTRTNHGSQKAGSAQAGHAASSRKAAHGAPAPQGTQAQTGHASHTNQAQVTHASHATHATALARRPAQTDGPSAADALTHELKSMGGIALQVPVGAHVKVGQKTIIKVTVMSTDLDAKSITVQAKAESGLTRTGSKLSKVLNAMKMRKQRTVAFEFQGTEPGQHLVTIEVDRTTIKGIDSRSATLLVTVTE